MKIILIGLSLTTICLIALEFVYAGVLGNLWYFINIIFWLLCALIFCWDKKSHSTSFRLKIICMLIIGSVLGSIFILHVPSYTYNEAIKKIEENVPETQKYSALHSRKYWNLVRNYKSNSSSYANYLIVFDSNPIQAFYFDPYTGDYGSFDIASEFPYLSTTDGGSS